MARLPAAIQLDTPRGARPAVAAVAVTDYGLGEVAKGVGQIGQALAQRDDDDAEKALVEARTAFDGGFADKAARYDGRTPGFAAGTMAEFDATTAAARAKLGGGAAMAFDRAALKERLSVFDRASSVEASASAEVMHRQQEADRTTRVAASAAQILAGTQDELNTAFKAEDPAAPGFAAGQIAKFDARAKTALEGASEEDRPHLQVQLANQRANLTLKVAGAARDLTAARTADGIGTGLSALTNAVNADPKFLPEAMAQVDPLLAALPADDRIKARKGARSDLAQAAVQGMVAREDWPSVRDALDDPSMKQDLPDQAYAQFSARATQALNSQQRQLAAGTVSRQLASELASIRETGQGTGFDPNSLLSVYGPVDGPAKVAEARQGVADAKLVHQTTHDFAALTPADQAARLELIKPKAGDPQFARKQALYETAVAEGIKQQALRSTDPALAIQADAASKALWLATQDGKPTSARAWAADALARQEALGLAPEAQRVLPAGEAKRLVEAAHAKDPTAHAQALAGLYGYAERFGDQSGRVLYELQQAGLSGEEAAMIHFTEADPVLTGAYTRSVERLPTAKLDKGETEKLTQAVDHALAPLVGSFAGSASGQAYADGLRSAAIKMATAGHADGRSIKDAATQATRLFTQRVYVDPKGGWRAPLAEAGRRDAGVAVEVFARGASEAVIQKKDGAEAIRQGSLRAMRDLVLDGGKTLQPRGNETWLTGPQKQQRYADLIAHEGRWETSDDDAGLVLTVPDPRGGRAPVLTDKGRPVVKRWDELIKRAGSL